MKIDHVVVIERVGQWFLLIKQKEYNYEQKQWSEWKWCVRAKGLSSKCGTEIGGRIGSGHYPGFERAGFFGSEGGFESLSQTDGQQKFAHVELYYKQIGAEEGDFRARKRLRKSKKVI